MVRMHAQKRKEASLGPFPSPWSSFSNSFSIGRLDFQDAHEDDSSSWSASRSELNTELSTDRSAEVQFGSSLFVRRASITPDRSSEGLSNGQIAFQDLQGSDANERPDGLRSFSRGGWRFDSPTREGPHPRRLWHRAANSAGVGWDRVQSVAPRQSCPFARERAATVHPADSAVLGPALLSGAHAILDLVFQRTGHVADRPR